MPEVAEKINPQSKSVSIFSKINEFQCALNEAESACEKAKDVLEEARDFMFEMAQKLSS